MCAHMIHIGLLKSEPARNNDELDFKVPMKNVKTTHAAKQKKKIINVHKQ